VPTTNDYTAQVRLALQQTNYLRAVLLHSVELIEQLEQDSGRVDRARQASKDETGEGAAGDSPSDTPEAGLLRELHARPSEAWFTPREVAAYIGVTAALLRTWRWQRRGPPFDGRGRLIRYLKRNLDVFMAS
jgi:hypothetical protein